MCACYMRAMPALKDHPRISIDDGICNGQPRVTGTEVPIDIILKNFRAGASTGWIIERLPQLTRSDVKAVLLYAVEAGI